MPSLKIPKVSVIIPAFNHQEYVLEAVESVLGQSLKDLELIIIDDGSTDNTLEQLKRVIDERVRLFTQENQGAAKTINRGIGLAKGQYISILNSDDAYHPERLEKMSGFLDDHPSIMIVSSLIEPIDSTGSEVTQGSEHGFWLDWYEGALKSREKDESPAISLLKSNYIVSTSNIFLRSAIFDYEEKFSEVLTYCHDYEFLLRVIKRYGFFLFEERLLRYRLHEGNTIRQNEFLRHLEILFAIFKTTDMEEILRKPSVNEREETPVFQALSRNPEINQTIKLTEIGNCLRELQSVVEEREGRLKEADEWLKKFQAIVKEKDEKLKEADVSSRELQSQVKERDERLREADGWLVQTDVWLREKDEKLKEADASSRAKDEVLREVDVWLREKDEKLKEADASSRAKDEVLREADVWLREKDEKLKEADVWLRELQSQVKDQEKRLEQAYHLLEEKLNLLNETFGLANDLKSQVSELQSQVEYRAQEVKGLYQRVESLEIQLQTKEQLLQEIFGSKGWRWLTRFREIKRKLSFQRLQLRRSENREDDKTYHAKILHPVQGRRPKVIYAIANFMTGGSSRLVVDLIEHLGHKYDQEVIAYFIPSRAAYSGFPVHDFSGGVTPEEIALFLRKKKADILHIHYWGEGDIYWYKKIFEAAEKYSCTVIENVNTPVTPFISDSVDQYIYVSEYAMNYTTPVAGKASFIHPGSNLSMFSRNGVPIPDDAIGMVYRLELDKLKEDSIQVFIEVVKRRPKTKVYIIGGGSLMDSYKTQLAEQGVSANFVMPGFVAYDQLPDYYRKLSLFVAPVWKESFGQVSSFAMGMEIPVVGYKMGALSEILGTDEFLASDTQELAEIILRLLDDREKRLEIGAYNYARVHELFSVEKMVEKYDLLYGKMLES